MRRTFITLSAVLALAGCGEGVSAGPAGDAAAPPPAETDAGHELLFLGMGTGVKVFDATAETVTVEAYPAAPSQQGNAVFRTVPRAGGTELAAFDPATGDARWSTKLAEPMELRIASQDGTAAVLGPVRAPDGSIPGRETTHLTVVRGPDDVEGYDVPGNVEPETFSLDGNKLFLVDYLPPIAPTQYTLRLLDLETREQTEVFDAHGAHRRPMEGTARTHVYSPDGTRLYTYYQILGDPYYEHLKGPYYAFVHVLDLKEGWAHCVVLAEPFGTAGTMRPALAVSPDGANVYVADQNLGLVAEIDTEMLRVARTSEIGAPEPDAPAAAAATDDSLFVSFGTQVRAVERASLTVASSFVASSDVGALHISRSGTRLYVALPDRVEVYDAATYERIDELLVGNLPVEYFDPSGVPLDATSDVIKCAC